MSVVIETTIGDITIDLLTEVRPRTCMNFIKLCKAKCYNHNLIYSVQRNFIAQTGDPTGTGRGGNSVFSKLYGEQARFYEGEKKPVLKHQNIGTVSMVNCGDNMFGSQFFITLGENLDSLDKEHLVFGKVAEGLETLAKLNEVIGDEDNRPYKDIRITHMVILHDPYPDPEIEFPPSPEPSEEILNSSYIAIGEEVNNYEGLTPEEIAEKIAQKEAEARATILEMVGDLPEVDAAPPDNVLFVCKLNPVTKSDDLLVIFSRFGKIDSCEVIKDQKTGNSLQYAFIEFEDPKSCEDAYFKMDNVLIDERRIHVDFSQSVSKTYKWNKKSGESNSTDDYDSKNHKYSKVKEKRDDRRNNADKHRDEKSYNTERHRDDNNYEKRNHDDRSNRERNRDDRSYENRNHDDRSTRERNRDDRTYNKERNRDERSYNNDKSRYERNYHDRSRNREIESYHNRDNRDEESYRSRYEEDRSYKGIKYDEERSYKGRKYEDERSFKGRKYEDERSYKGRNYEEDERSYKSRDYEDRKLVDRERNYHKVQRDPSYSRERYPEEYSQRERIREKASRKYEHRDREQSKTDNYREKNRKNIREKRRNESSSSSSERPVKKSRKRENSSDSSDNQLKAKRMKEEKRLMKKLKKDIKKKKSHKKKSKKMDSSSSDESGTSSSSDSSHVRHRNKKKTKKQKKLKNKKKSKKKKHSSSSDSSSSSD